MSRISFVLPIYNEAQNIPKLWEELTAVTSQLAQKYAIEYVFVNDASTDESRTLLDQLQLANPESVNVLHFSRNYGHQIAVTAGQDYATGDAIIIMDTDLQDPPAVCLELVQKWEEGWDVVYAQRRRYKTNFIKQTTAFVFYRLMAKIANVNIPVDTGDFRLLSKRVNDEMKKFREHSRFLRGISSLVGFKQTAVQFDRSPRFAGKPGYTFLKSLQLAFDGITSFSLFPLRFVTITGVLLSAASFILGLGYVIFSLLGGHAISGWASMMTVTFFLGGVQMLMLGILGEYIGRIYVESLNRPLYTLDNKDR